MSGLNEVLAKGINTLHSLLGLNLNFRGWKEVGTYDISKMYNQLFVDEDHLQYQLILFVDDMNPSNPVDTWVLVRAMYGVTCTDNQAETAIRRAATKFQDLHPLEADAILEQTCVDNGLPTEDTHERLVEKLNQVIMILASVGFLVKVFTLVYQTTSTRRHRKTERALESVACVGFPKTICFR